MAFCGNCGQKLLPNVKFCSNCGTPVPAEIQALNTGGGQASPAAPTNTPTPAPAASAAPAPAPASTPAPEGKIKAGGKSFATIQAAIDGVAAGTEIVIPEGNYNESIVVNKNVVLKGSGKNTIIYFKPQTYTDGFAVVKITSPCTIDNLCIQEDTNQGGITYKPVDFDGDDALVLVYADAVLKNLSVKNSEISGMNVINASPVIENCEFCFTYGLIFRGEKTNLSVKDSCFHHNQGGGGIFTEQCKGRFESCRFFENKAGVEVRQSQTQFYSCKFEDNLTHGVISTGDGSIPYFYDCDIHHNSKDEDGYAEVVIAKEANPFFKRCGIYDNSSYGAFIVDGGMGMFSECDFKDNDEDVSDDDESCKFVNCDFEGGTDYNNMDSEEDYNDDEEDEEED